MRVKLIPGLLAAALGVVVFAFLAAVSQPAGVAESRTVVEITADGLDPDAVEIEVGSDLVWLNRTDQTVYLRSGRLHVIFLPSIVRGNGAAAGAAHADQIAGAAHSHRHAGAADADCYTLKHDDAIRVVDPHR